VNLELLELATSALGELRDEVVFVGGATVELWISDPGAPEFRPTDDVDVVVPGLSSTRCLATRPFWGLRTAGRRRQSITASRGNCPTGPSSG
jgi:hypothetical protein